MINIRGEQGRVTEPCMETWLHISQSPHLCVNLSNHFRVSLSLHHYAILSFRQSLNILMSYCLYIVNNNNNIGLYRSLPCLNLPPLCLKVHVHVIVMFSSCKNWWGLFYPPKYANPFHHLPLHESSLQLLYNLSINV